MATGVVYNAIVYKNKKTCSYMQIIQKTCRCRNHAAVGVIVREWGGKVFVAVMVSDLLTAILNKFLLTGTERSTNEKQATFR